MAGKKKKKSPKRMRAYLRKIRLVGCPKCDAGYHWDEKLRRCMKTAESKLRKNKDYLRKHVSKSSTKKKEKDETRKQ